MQYKCLGGKEDRSKKQKTNYMTAGKDRCITDTGNLDWYWEQSVGCWGYFTHWPHVSVSVVPLIAAAVYLHLAHCCHLLLISVCSATSAFLAVFSSSVFHWHSSVRQLCLPHFALGINLVIVLCCSFCCVVQIMIWWQYFILTSL